MSFISDIFGFDIETPELTETEELLLQVSTDQYLRAVEEGQALTPFVLSSMGLTQDADGNLRNMTSDEYYAALDPIAQKEYTNISNTFDRIEAAQSGEKSEFLKQEDERILGEVAENRARQGGIITGEDLSTATGRTTADIQTLAEQQKISALRGDEERRAFETSLQGVNANNLGIFRNTQSNQVVQESAFPNRSSSTLTGILNAQQPYQDIRGLDTQVNAANASTSAAIAGLGGTLGYGIIQDLI